MKEVIRMNKFREVMNTIMRFLNAAALAFLTLLAVWQVITRYLLNDSSTWSEELASYMFAWVTLLGAAYVFGQMGHMNIPILIERLSQKMQKYLMVIIQLIILAFAVIVLIYGGSQITSLTMGQMSSSLGVPMGYFYLSLPISGVFTAIYTVLNLYDIFADKEDVVEDTPGRDLDDERREM